MNALRTSLRRPGRPGQTRTRSKRRVVAIVLASLGALSLVGYGSFRAFAPGYRPALEPGEAYGIDVSRHQGTIDWQKVAADDIEFAYIKATEGGDWVDPQFQENWEGARAAGLKVGAYHFFRSCTDGAKQARNVLATVPDDATSLPIALDVESGGICGGVDDPKRISAEFQEFVDMVERERGETIFYVLPGFEYLLKDDETHPMWRRFIWIRPRQQWAIWQASWFVEVQGIEGPVDLNIMSAASVERWLET